jgi:hypothetical protein
MPRSIARINRLRAETAARREETYQTRTVQQDADELAVILALIKQVGLDVDSGTRFFNTTATAQLVNIFVDNIVRSGMFRHNTPAIRGLISQLDILNGQTFQGFEELFAKLFWPIIKVCGFVFFYQIQKRIIFYVNSFFPQSPFVSIELRSLLEKAKDHNYVSENLKTLKHSLVEQRAALKKRQTHFAMRLYFITYIILFVSGLNWLSAAYRGEKKLAIKAMTGQLETQAFALLAPILAMGYFFLKSIFTEWDREKVISVLLDELNTQFATDQHQWSAYGDRKATTILYINFSDNEVVLEVDGDEVILSEADYFSELSIVLIENQPEYMALLQSGLYVSLESMAKLTLSEIKARLIIRLKRFSSAQIIRQQQIITTLNRYNNTYGYGNNEWGEITNEQGHWTVYCHFIKQKPEMLIKELKTKYELKVDIGEEDLLLSIVNPHLMVPESHVAQSAVAARPIEPMRDYPHPKARDKVLSTIHHVARTPMHSSRPTAPPKQNIIVEFVADGLRLHYESQIYVEETAALRPIYAEWLPAYSHFSYLDPILVNYLYEKNLLDRVQNALRSGETYSAIVPKTKEAGVGIKRTHDQAYTNVHGRACVSHYKIKVGRYRIHGRWLSTAADGRKQLYIFDGCCLGH